VAVADGAVLGDLLFEAQAIGRIGMQVVGDAGAFARGAGFAQTFVVFVVVEGVAGAVGTEDTGSGIRQVKAGVADAAVFADNVLS
jgi:hypothetical protein